MHLANNAFVNEATISAELEPDETESITDVAVAVDEAAYLCGWDDAIRAVRGAMRNANCSEPDDYFEGWMDAITHQPIDTSRIATSRAGYALGFAAGAREYEHAHCGGFDAE